MVGFGSWLRTPALTKSFPSLAPERFRGFLFGRVNAPSPRVGDPKGVVASLRCMSPSKEYYRVRAEECCRMAILVSEIDKRIHWLEAAARWLSLGREQASCCQGEANQGSRHAVSATSATKPPGAGPFEGDQRLQSITTGPRSRVRWHRATADRDRLPWPARCLRRLLCGISHRNILAPPLS